MTEAAIERRAQRRELLFDRRVVRCFASRERSVYEGFAQAVDRHAGSIALCFGGARWTYRELAREVGRFAAGLTRLGVGPGDRVAMQLRNRPEFVFAFFAVQRLGAVAVPIDVRLQAAEVGHVLDNSGARVLLHDRELDDRLRALPQGGVERVALAEGGGDDVFSDAGSGDATPCRPSGDEAIAAILYTSGTTGRPKGAAIAHVNFVHSVRHHVDALGLRADDRALIALPLGHITGLLCGVLAPLLTGGTLVLQAQFKAAPFLAEAAASRMTYTVMVPAMYHLCLRHEGFDQLDLGAWRLGHFGGAPMPQATIDALARRLPKLRLVHGYGATEVCSPAAMWPAEGPPCPRTSVGRAMDCAEILVVDPDRGIELPSGGAGELWIRGPMVIPGYWNDAESTQRSFVDGYWRSGDLGHVDADGNVYVLDRLKDLVNRGGYKIYSAEVENVLMQHGRVLEAAVVGRPDPVLGERVHAFVSVDGTSTTAELQAHCAACLADYKVPETWTLQRGALPRTSTGKVDKKALRASLGPAEVQSPSPPQGALQ